MSHFCGLSHVCDRSLCLVISGWIFCEQGIPLAGDENACEGNSIPWAPEWTAFAVLRGGFEAGNGEIFGSVAWTWEDDTRVDWIGTEFINQQLALINQTDITIGYRTDNWSVRAYVENVFDGEWFDAAYPDDDPASPYVEHAFGPSRPLTAGIRFGYNW